MQQTIKKTSEEWFSELTGDVTILDPDGWDRSDFEFSWHKEKITQYEFNYRLCSSTIIWKMSKL